MCYSTLTLTQTEQNMKVAELIEMLEGMNQEAEVHFSYN